MKNIWYADKRDLVKWTILVYLSKDFEAERILQIAFYRKDKFDSIQIDGQNREIPQEVIAHFRDIHDILRMKSAAPIEVFDLIFDDKQRQGYLEGIIKLIKKYTDKKLIVFLDPDTGLESKGQRGDKHILEKEAKAVWEALKPRDVFVLYQHHIRKKDWIKLKQNQLAKAIGLSPEAIKYAYGPKIAKDVVFFYAQQRC